MSIGKNIKAFREELNMTQEQNNAKLKFSISLLYLNSQLIKNFPTLLHQIFLQKVF